MSAWAQEAGSADPPARPTGRRAGIRLPAARVDAGGHDAEVPTSDDCQGENVDAIQLIQKDHRDIERLFKELERADRADAPGRAGSAVRELVRELSTHAVIEEQY